MISVGNNFFYTKSLPCSLWFFDKGKPAERLDKVLFIDARNYYTVVDRTLNEWSEWQLKNLNAIVWLYRGEIEKYQALLEDYRNTIFWALDHTWDPELFALMDPNMPFADTKDKLTEILNSTRDNTKKAVAEAAARERKKVQAAWDEHVQELEAILTIAGEAVWLSEKFGEGTYQDIPGLCRLADHKEIEEKGWSLTPGAYVGVAPVEDDGVDFHQRMAEIHAELLELQAQSNELMETISLNMKEMGI